MKLFAWMLREHNPHAWRTGPLLRVTSGSGAQVKRLALQAVAELRADARLERPVVLPISYADHHAAFAVYEPRGARPRLFAFDAHFCMPGLEGVYSPRYKPLSRLYVGDDAAVSARVPRAYDRGFRLNSVPEMHRRLGCVDTCALVALAVLRRMLALDQPDPRVVQADMDPDHTTAAVAELRGLYTAKSH